MKDLNRCQKCHSTKDLLVVSRHLAKSGEERVHKMCRKCNTDRMRKYVNNPKNRETVYKSVYASMKRHADRQFARYQLNYQIGKGNIIRPKICTVCLESKKIEGHHTDYTKPLDVIWACRQCHADLHKNKTEL